MAIYTEMEAAMRADDADRYTALLAEDFEYVRHKSKDTIGRDAMRDLLKKVWRPGNRIIEDMRCVYENDDILVNGSGEIVLGPFLHDRPPEAPRADRAD